MDPLLKALVGGVGQIDGGSGSPTGALSGRSMDLDAFNLKLDLVQRHDLQGRMMVALLRVQGDMYRRSAELMKA